MTAVEHAFSTNDLQDLVDRLGEDPVDWPTTWRAPVRALVDGCEEAQAILAQAQALRAQLSTLGVRAPQCFADKVLAVALAIDPPAPSHHPYS